LVSPLGDVYIDTTEANSKVDVFPKVKRMGVEAGGSIQVDIKSSRQLEFNWNAPIEGLKAGSNSASQSREESKPHLTAPKKPVGDPGIRETTRTLIRGSQFDLLFKTSLLEVFCQNSSETGGKEGSFIVAAEDQITLTQKEASESDSATINLASGAIVLSAKDGSSVTISDDQVVLITKSGAQVSLVGGAILISGPAGVSVPVPLIASSSVALGGTPGTTVTLGSGTGEKAVRGESFAAAMSAFATAVGAAVVQAGDGGAVLKTGLTAAANDLAAAVLAALSETITIGV
jgi:hypothetical protein